MRKERPIARLLAILAFAGCGGRSEGLPPDYWPPDRFGPYLVGFVDMSLTDTARQREIYTAVWYPAESPPAGAEPVLYLELLSGQAVEEAPPQRGRAPYPLLLFSHGNQGVAVQSFSLCEHLASQGFVVAAPNHPGNTLMENPSDEQMAQVALERPLDMMFIRGEMERLSAGGHPLLAGLIDPQRVAVFGHSFGGYTVLVLAGARADRDRAIERCQTTRPDDVMCPYLDYWPVGFVQERPTSATGLSAALALAPGGYGAFGDEGLESVDLPLLLAGGDLDEFTAAELRPIYQAVGPPRAHLEIAGAGHLSFSDVCRANLPVPELEELCDPEKFLDPDRVFAITDAYAAAFMRRFLKGEVFLEKVMGELGAAFPEASFVAEW